jgi:hypothetical protein
VVATSNGPLADKLNPRDGVMATTADASYADYQRRNADHPGWYPVSLPALSAEDVAVMASREFALSSGARRGGAASAVYRYTDGHTGTARALLNAMKQAGQADLAAVLGRARPGASAPLADELLADLLAGASARATDNLVTASAARDQEAALQLGKASGVMEGMTWDTRAGRHAAPGTAGAAPGAAPAAAAPSGRPPCQLPGQLDGRPRIAAEDQPGRGR